MTQATKMQALFVAMIVAAKGYEAAAAPIRAMRAKGTEIGEVREACVAALLQKMPAYRPSLQENGNFEKGSAAQKAFSKLMRATDPEQGAVVNQKRSPRVTVPKALEDAVAKLLTTYDKAQIKKAMALFK